MVTDLVATPDRGLFAYQVSLKGEEFRVRVFVRRWPFAANDPIEVVRDRHVSCLGLDDGGRLAVGIGTQIEVVSTTTGEALATRGISEYVSEVVWSPGGHELVVIGDGSVTGYTPELEPRWRVELPYASSVAFSPDGARMALGGWESGVVGIRAA